MEFEKKILSREIQQFLYGSGLTVGSAESCTGGRIAESIIAVPGASTYFKGGVISYTNEVKENLLGVDHSLLEEKTAVCEDVAKEMVKGNDNLEILDGEVFTDKYAFAFKKGNTELEEKVNKVLQKLIDEGKVDEFTLKHTTGAGADADSKAE